MLAPIAGPHQPSTTGDVEIDKPRRSQCGDELQLRARIDLSSCHVGWQAASSTLLKSFDGIWF